MTQNTEQKNRDFSQVRIGTIIGFDRSWQMITAGKAYPVRFIESGGITFRDDDDCNHNIMENFFRANAYIIGQPDENYEPPMPVLKAFAETLSQNSEQINYDPDAYMAREHTSPNMANTEQNVQTRRDQLSTYPESVSVGRYSGDAWQLELDADDLDPDLLVEGPVLYVRCDIAHQSQKEDEARGAEEQRRKDAEIAGYRSTIDLLLQAIEAPQPIDAHLDPSVPDPVDYAREMTKRRKSLERMIADLREAKKQAFNQGYLIACCNLTNLHDEPSVACDVLAECGLTERDIEIADLTEYDAKALVKIRSARGGRDPIRAVLTREGGV